ncbi:hypothetical protein HDU96_003843, partial [Phlyctochytrium bullatum]
MSNPPTPPYVPDATQSTSAGISSSAHLASVSGSAPVLPAVELASVNLSANFHTKGITPFTGDVDTFLAWHAQLRNLIAMYGVTPLLRHYPTSPELVLVDARLQGFIRSCLHPTIQTEFEFYTSAKDLVTAILDAYRPTDTSVALHHLQALFSVTSQASTTPQAALDTLLQTIANHGRQFEALMSSHQLTADHRLALVTLALAQQLNQDFASTVQIFSHKKISDVSLNSVKSALRNDARAPTIPSASGSAHAVTQRRTPGPTSHSKHCKLHGAGNHSDETCHKQHPCSVCGAFPGHDPKRCNNRSSKVTAPPPSQVLPLGSAHFVGPSFASLSQAPVSHFEEYMDDPLYSSASSFLALALLLLLGLALLFPSIRRCLAVRRHLGPASSFHANAVAPTARSLGSSPFLLDSACTFNLVSDANLLLNCRTLPPSAQPAVRTASGLTAHLATVGDLPLMLFDGSTYRPFILPNVYHSPSLPTNLLSISSLNSFGLGCWFPPDGPAILSLNGKPVALSTRQDGVFPLVTRPPLADEIGAATRLGSAFSVSFSGLASPVCAAAPLSGASLHDLWHCRAGHLSSSSLN